MLTQKELKVLKQIDELEMGNFTFWGSQKDSRSLPYGISIHSIKNLCKKGYLNVVTNHLSPWGKSKTKSNCIYTEVEITEAGYEVLEYHKGC